MSTLYERLGHGTYVELVEQTGGKVHLQPRQPRTHRFEECRKPHKCAVHREQKARVEAAKRQARTNREAMARVGGAL